MSINDKIKTPEELNEAMRKLVKFIMESFECTYNVPLTQQEQAVFIRSVYYQAQMIRNTAPFAGADLQKALDEFMVKSNELHGVDVTPAKKKKGRK